MSDTKQNMKEGRWAPDECPITGKPFFLWLSHPEFGYVPTYGGPFDSFMIAEPDEDGYYRAEHYCHDRGDWIEGGTPVTVRKELTVTAEIEIAPTQGADARPVAISDMQRIALQQVREILRKGDWKYYGEVIDELLATHDAIEQAGRATAEQSRDSVIEECVSKIQLLGDSWVPWDYVAELRALKSQQDAAIESKPAEQDEMTNICQHCNDTGTIGPDWNPCTCKGRYECGSCSWQGWWAETCHLKHDTMLLCPDCREPVELIAASASSKPELTSEQRIAVDFYVMNPHCAQTDFKLRLVQANEPDAATESHAAANGAKKFGPFEVTWLGPCVWAGIIDELPSELYGKRVYLIDAAIESQRSGDGS